MSAQLNNLLSKIPNELENLPLLFQSEKVNSQLKNINQKSLNIPFYKKAHLAILLQNLDINIFSLEDLYFLANLKMEYLGTRAFPITTSSILSPNNPIQDTGDERVYSLLDKEDIIATSLQLNFVGVNSYEGVSLKEMILALYMLGG